MMLGWKDRKTGRLYDWVGMHRILGTKGWVTLYRCQISQQVYAVIEPFEMIEVDGEMVTRFCQWGINTGHADDGFN